MQTDRRVVIFNAMIPQARDVHRLHDALERFDQIQHMCIFDFDGKFVFVGVGNHPAAMRTRNISARTFKSQSIERTRCGTELLICQKLLHEFEAWISSLALVFSSRINLRRCPRRKRSALDFDKRCRHHQKFSCKFNIDSVNVFQESEILLGDHRNRNVGDIDFGSTNKKEQKVQRSLKTGEANFIIILQCHRRRVSANLARMKAPVGTSELAFLAEVIEAESTALGSMARGLRGGSSDCNGWTRALDLLESCTGHVVVAGLGKSGLIGAKISATLASLGQPSHVIHPSEAVHGDLGRMREGDIALLLSYSGETAEVIDLALHLKADGIARIGISCRATTNLARLCDAHVSVGDIVEACPLNLAPTASTTAMLAAGDALALALARRRNFQADDFHRHHPGGMLGAGLRQITEALRFRVGNNLTVVSDSVTVRKALAAAGEGRRAGAIMLVDADGRLSGIFTDGDLRRLVNGGGLEALDSLVSTVMTARPTCLTVDALVRDAVRLVQEKRLDEIPVVDLAGKPLGLVDVQDLIAMRVVEG